MSSLIEIREAIFNVVKEDSIKFKEYIDTLCMLYKANNDSIHVILRKIENMLSKFSDGTKYTDWKIEFKIINRRHLDPFSNDVNVGLLHIIVPYKYLMILECISKDI